MNRKVRAKPHGKICDIGARNGAFQGRKELEHKSPFTLPSSSPIGRLRGGGGSVSPVQTVHLREMRGGDTCLNPLTSPDEALGPDTSVRVSNFA